MQTLAKSYDRINATDEEKLRGFIKTTTISDESEDINNAKLLCASMLRLLKASELLTEPVKICISAVHRPDVTADDIAAMAKLFEKKSHIINEYLGNTSKTSMQFTLWYKPQEPNHLVLFLGSNPETERQEAESLDIWIENLREFHVSNYLPD